LKKDIRPQINSHQSSDSLTANERTLVTIIAWIVHPVLEGRILILLDFWRFSPFNTEKKALSNLSPFTGNRFRD